MDAKEVFARAVDEVSGVVKLIEPDQLKNPTPCTDWDLRTLLNHMVYELSWVPDILAGKTVKEIGNKYDGELLGDDAQAAWKHAAQAAVDAVKKADLKATVHLSYGDFPAEYYIRECGGDMLIHGWDLTQAISCSLYFEPDVAVIVYEDYQTKKGSLAESGLFGLPIEVPDDVSIEVKLLALVGRKTAGM